MTSTYEDLILIVDDSPTNISALLEMLHEADLRFLIAKSGESALEQLRSLTPDLIMLDVTMPGIDGFETCRRLKQSPNTSDIPVIFMTASSDEQDKVKGFNLGAVDYITKPLHREEVLARVQVHLNLRNLTKRLEQRVGERTAELANALDELQQSQLQLIQSEKMSALGQLLAGVAHEVNNPVGAITSNIIYATRYVNSLIQHLQLYQAGANPEEITTHAQDVDLKYLIDDLPKVLHSIKDSTTRIKDISASLRIFSRSDHESKVSFNLHDGIDSTLMILQHRLRANNSRPEIEIVKQYGELPAIDCFPGQLNQVFMNLLANAIDALDESNRERSYEDLLAQPNQIQIQTKLSADSTQAIITIGDNGTGIPDAIKQQIFDYSFTTKPVGKGTGFGLAIARQIIVEKHQGYLAVESVPGESTEFTITIPVHVEI